MLAIHTLDTTAHSKTTFVVIPLMKNIFSLCLLTKDEGERDSNSPIIRVTRATPVLPPGVTDDTPDFDREMVMLDIPGELYGNSFTIVTNISKVFGDWLMVSKTIPHSTIYKLEFCIAIAMAINFVFIVL